MRSFLKEYAMTILSCLIGVLLLMGVSPVGGMIGNTLTDVVVKNSENHAQVVAAITPTEGDENDTGYDKIDVWYGIENTNIVFNKVSGNSELVIEHEGNYIVIENRRKSIKIKDARLGNTVLKVSSQGVIKIEDDFVQEDKYYTLKCTLEDKKTIVYVFK